MAFVKMREERTEQLLNDAELCDAVAVVGVEQCRIPCHRAQLANVSDPLRHQSGHEQPWIIHGGKSAETSYRVYTGDF